MSLKYFKTGNASRRYKKDNITVEFEPLIFEQGSWVGAISFEENSPSAKALSGFGPPVTEISEAEFNRLKKKPMMNSTDSSEVLSETTPAEETPSRENPVADSLDEEIGYGSPKDSVDAPEKAKASPPPPPPPQPIEDTPVKEPDPELVGDPNDDLGGLGLDEEK